MSNTCLVPSSAVELYWRTLGITECILMEERIVVTRARERFWRGLR